MRLMLLDVKAYTSDVRGEPCAAAQDQTVDWFQSVFVQEEAFADRDSKILIPSGFAAKQGREVV